jgi:hypothetical protein
MSTIQVISAERQPTRTTLTHASAIVALAAGVVTTALFTLMSPSLSQAQEKRPNIVVLLTDDTGWNDFGAYPGGGAASVIRHQTSIRLPKRVPRSQAGTDRLVARRVARRS